MSTSSELQMTANPLLPIPKPEKRPEVEAMWAVSPTISRPCLLPLPPSTTTVSANSRPPRPRSKPPKDFKGLGHTIFTALNSIHPNATPYPIPKQQKQEQQEGRQISGSDVLWALQRAAAQKNEKTENKKSKKKGVSSSNHREEVGVDYSKVRSLCIKSEWGVRLEDLEKRLQGLSETH